MHTRPRKLAAVIGLEPSLEAFGAHFVCGKCLTMADSGWLGTICTALELRGKGERQDDNAHHRLGLDMGQRFAWRVHFRFLLQIVVT